MNESITPAPRGHAADAALEGLFIEILDGQLAPGESLPAERLLAERYGVSRITVRQAVHKLKDAGLVEVRQGGASRVLDPARADARIFELLLRCADRLQSDAATRLLRDLAEYQQLYAIGLLEAASRHATDAEREHLLQQVDTCPATLDAAEAQRLEDAFWRRITAIGRNRILQMEMALWQRWTDDQDAIDGDPAELRWFYLTLARQLLARQDPVPFYLASVRTTSA